MLECIKQLKNTVITFFCGEHNGLSLLPIELKDKNLSLIDSDWAYDTFEVMKIQEAYKVTGKNIKLGLLDSGIRKKHPNFIKEHIKIKDFTNSGFPKKDKLGHGTMVSSIIIGQGKDTDKKGIAPNAKIFMAKVFNNSKDGNISHFLDGLNELINQKPDIISMSLEIKNINPDDQGLLKDYLERAYRENIILIAGAGRPASTTSKGITLPGLMPDMITVGSIGKCEKNNEIFISKFSREGKELDIMAPGENIKISTKNEVQNKVGSGTSFSIPFIAGVVALLKEYYIKLEKKYNVGLDVPKFEFNQKNVKKLLNCSAKDFIPEPGRDDKSGYGVIDIYEAFIQLEAKYHSV